MQLWAIWHETFDNFRFCDGAETHWMLAEIRRLILRIPCGEYLLLAEITGYNLRKRCGECSFMSERTGPGFIGTGHGSPSRSLRSGTSRAGSSATWKPSDLTSARKPSFRR